MFMDADKFPVIVALPVWLPSHSAVTPVKPEPSPTKEDAETWPDAERLLVTESAPAVSVPEMDAFPVWLPSHSAVIPVRFEPSP